MIRSNTYQAEAQSGSWLAAKWKDISALIKLRLSTIVVFSAGIGYLMAAGDAFSWMAFGSLLLGGMLVTGSANAFNEVIEKDTDALMSRTADRPIPAGRMSTTTGIVIAGFSGLLGILLLWLMLNPICALLGALSLISYSFVYTPFKRISSIAVFIGAIPGAMSPLLGWVAVTGEIGPAALALFAIQFFWQFPHFWAIAWLGRDDYEKAGFDLLPSPTGRTKASAIHIILYTAMLLPVSILPLMLGMSGMVSAVIALVSSILFLGQAVQLYRTCDMKAARSLMFGSFVYLPVVFLALVFDKL